MRHFLAPLYPADLKDSPAGDLEEVASIDVPAGDLEVEADWGMPNLTGAPDLGSRGIIICDYGRLHEACSVVKASVPSSVADILWLEIHVMEAMSRESILKGRVGALELTSPSENTRFGKL